MKASHFLVLPAVLALFSTITHAASITWGPATGITGESDVSLDGMLVRAFNVGILGSGSPVINGVPFEQFAVSSTIIGAPTSVTIGNFTLAVAVGGNLLGGAGFGSVAAPFSNLPVAYQSMLSSAALTLPLNRLMTLTMNGLTAGATYEFQWWANVSATSEPTLNITATAGNSVTLLREPSGLEGGLGQFAKGTFIADGTNQTITFNSSNSAPVLNGFQMRQIANPVPEPTSALFGVALCAVTAIRRRRRTLTHGPRA